MTRTNVIYTATVTNSGSTTTELFDPDNIQAVLAGDKYGSTGMWGNAIVPSGVLFFARPTSGPYVGTANRPLASEDIAYGDLSLNHATLSFERDTSIGLDFGSPVQLDALRLLCWHEANDFSVALASNASDAFEVHTSSDNVTWTSHATYSINQSLNKGELLFSFSPVTARYFQVYNRNFIDPKWRLDGSTQNYHLLEINKVFGIDNSLGSTANIIIDLQREYKGATFEIETHSMRRDRDALGIYGSADGISYSSNLRSYGDSWTTKTPAPFSGRIYHSSKHKDIRCLKSDLTELAIYDIEENTWSTQSIGITGVSGFITAFDDRTSTFYAFGGTTGKELYYIKDTLEWGRLRDAPYAKDTYSTMEFGLDKLWIHMLDTSLAANLETYNMLESSILVYDLHVDAWDLLVNPTIDTNLPWSDGYMIMKFLDEPTVQSSPIFLINQRTNATILSYALPYFSVYGGMVGNFKSFGTGDLFKSGAYGELTHGPQTDSAPNLEWAPDRRRIYMVGPRHGASSKVRPWDAYYDVDRNEFYSFPAAYATSFGGDLYHFGGIGPNTDIAYVPYLERMYRIGQEDGSGSSTDFAVYNMGRMNRYYGDLSDSHRYIKVRNASSTLWPLVITHMGVYVDGQDIRFQNDDEDFVYGYDNSFSIGGFGNVREVKAYNAGNTATSGTAYIEPDGSEGSRYFQIATTSGGTYVGHCVYNDLPNFQCLANNSNYDTISCGMACTSGTGGPSATAGYQTAFLSTGSVPASGTVSWYVRSAVPSGTENKPKTTNIITEFYE